MPNLTDLITATRELREVIKISNVSTVSSDLRTFTIGIPAATSLRFSLPARSLWVSFQSANTSLFGAPVSCASDMCGRLITIASQFATSIFQTGAVGAFDLSDMIVWCGATVSGATLNAFVRTAAQAAV